METKKRLYLVSFGESNQYRVEFDDVANVDPYHHTNPLAETEAEIKEFLDAEFPGESLAYFDTPKIEEVDWAKREDYASYPELDAAAVEDIKRILKTGVENFENQEALDLNAPFAE